MTALTGGALLALALVLGGCTPEPAPQPTPTSPFTSEEEAFAAAEATYRAYVDALNQVDLSDPETFEPVFAWTTGELNSSDRSGLSEYHAAGARVSGESVVTLLEPDESKSSTNSVVLYACVDISSVDVFDANGNSLVSPERPDVQSTRVTLEYNARAQKDYLVGEIAPREEGPSCAS